MLRVLIVDDEPVIADSLAYALSDFGYDATAVYDGQEALKSAAALNPDVLISDVVMPGMNGIEAGIQIRRMHNTTIDRRLRTASTEPDSHRSTERARPPLHFGVLCERGFAGAVSRTIPHLIALI